MGYWSCEGGLGVNGLARRVVTIRKIKALAPRTQGRDVNSMARPRRRQAKQQENQSIKQARMDHKKKQSRKKRERERRISFAQEVASPSKQRPRISR